MLVNVNIDLLRAFVTVVDLKSFTRAADQLFRTQSTISLQIKRLESLTQAELLKRDSRSVELTSKGTVIYDYANKILALHDEMRRDISRQDPPKDVIRVGTPDDYAKTLLPGVFAAFREWMPNVEISVVSEISTLLRQRVSDGGLDIAVVTGNGQNGSEVELRQESLHWVAVGNGAAAKAEPLPLAVFTDGCIFRERALAELRTIGRSFVIAYSSNSFAGLMAAIRSGSAISVLAESSIEPDLHVLGDTSGLPDLGTVAIRILKGPSGQSRACRLLAETIETVLSVPDISSSAAMRG